MGNTSSPSAEPEPASFAEIVQFPKKTVFLAGSFKQPAKGPQSLVCKSINKELGLSEEHCLPIETLAAHKVRAALRECLLVGAVTMSRAQATLQKLYLELGLLPIPVRLKEDGTPEEVLPIDRINEATKLSANNELPLGSVVHMALHASKKGINEVVIAGIGDVQCKINDAVITLTNAYRLDGSSLPDDAYKNIRVHQHGQAWKCFPPDIHPEDMTQPETAEIRINGDASAVTAFFNSVPLRFWSL